MMLPHATVSLVPVPAHPASVCCTQTRFATVWRSNVARWLMALLLSTATPTLVVAQTSEPDQTPRPSSRAELLEAARRAKTAALEPPTRTAVERGIRGFRDGVEFVGNIQEGWKGFHFATGDFPAGAGFCLGRTRTGKRCSVRSQPLRGSTRPSSSRQTRPLIHFVEANHQAPRVPYVMPLDRITAGRSA